MILASKVHYEEISFELTEFGLEELKDAIPYDAFGKMEFFTWQLSYRYI